jgi:hypothetical protein
MAEAKQTGTVSEQDRRLLATALFRLFDHWHLAESEQSSLLGLRPEQQGDLRVMRQSGLLAPNPTIAERTRALLRIYRYLGMVFTQNYDLARGWMMTSNLRLDGDSPFEKIQKKGDAGIRAVTNLLEEQLF